MGTLTFTDRLTILECGECHMSFAVPEAFDRKNQETGRGWYCPAGHSRIYRDPEVVRLRREREQLQDRLDRQVKRTSAVVDERDAANRSLSATKGVVTRTKRRIANGVCPCCQRTFADLARHMKGQHPTYTEAQNV